MSSIKILAIALILAGTFGLAYGSLSYTQETHEAKIGSLELSVKDNQTINIPSWLASVAICGGALLLLFDRKRA